ncbi:hypothetical protein E3N88_40129 [Mikania micrantha]|uniref:Transmembrane protein n=1 Tax=Mikania micrantha TaxID=192012 RepID=A0A5N6LLS0_9ASTR|nr:hypothetical protein E3N88_40129 [Mikania micrantha]
MEVTSSWGSQFMLFSLEFEFLEIDPFQSHYKLKRFIKLLQCRIMGLQTARKLKILKLVFKLDISKGGKGNRHNEDYLVLSGFSTDSRLRAVVVVVVVVVVSGWLSCEGLTMVTLKRQG